MIKKHWKKILSVALVFSVTASLCVIKKINSKAATASYNYAEALQKGIMFYEFQKSGDLSNTIERNNWRGNSGMNDGADVGLDLTGGWYDAGDHVKFNLPMSYTSTMLAWSYLEDTDVYTSSGEDKYILDEIKWANDYFIKCHPSANEYYYQVGNGGTDHAFWGSAEIMQMERPAYKLDMNNPGSAVSAETAASLAACSIVFADSNPSYASTCLTHAKQLLSFAEATKSDDGYMKQAAGFYSSYSGFYDELSWANIWLYKATGDESYIDKAIAFSDNWERVQGTDTIAYKWAHGWDDVHIGSSLFLAEITGQQKFKTAIENHLNYWSVGLNGEKITYTPKGLAWLDTWGSLRYACTTAFIASVYADWDGCSATDATNYRNFAKTQADYVLGSTGRSFVCGFGVNPPVRPHHRTTHGAWENNISGAPSYSRHTLVGALVGGPDASDGYTDVITDYVSNEVADDYNAGFVGLMAKMYKQYGGTLVKNLSAVEEVGDELYLEAGINAKDSTNNVNFIEIKAVVYNITSWPARVTDKLSYRYFIDISDVIAAGYSASDMTVSANYNQSGAKLSLKPWNASSGIYYVDVDLSGALIYPGGQSQYKSELQFRVSAPGKWDFTKSPSYTGLASTSSNNLAKATNMALYDDGKLVYGSEPNGGSVATATVKPTATVAPTTVAPTTVAPTTVAPTTVAPTTIAPTTVVPTTVVPTATVRPTATITPTTVTPTTVTPVTSAMNFVVQQTTDTRTSSNTLVTNFTVTNKESNDIDLSKLSFRYFFTADGEEELTTWCDQVAGQFVSDPWYKNYTSNATGKVVKMNPAVTGADRYIEFTFDSNDKIPLNTTIIINARTAKSNWSLFDQENDFSYNDSTKIAVYYDGVLVTGIEP